MSSAPLFETPNFQSIDEQIKAMKLIVDKKCQSYNITFGLFKTPHGPIDYTSMLVYKTKTGESQTCSFSGESVHDLLNKIITHLNPSA